MDLKDIVGEPSQFYLSMPNKVFHLRPFTIGDRLWVQNTFGAEVKLEKMSSENLCRLAFQLMELEDKREFLAKDVEFINEHGESFVKRLGGPELMFWQVSGMEETQNILLALIKSITGSKVLDKMTAEEKKSFPPERPAGMKSSTPYRVNTDGPRKKSSRAPKKKSPSGCRPYRSARI